MRDSQEPHTKVQTSNIIKVRNIYIHTYINTYIYGENVSLWYHRLYLDLKDDNKIYLSIWTYLAYSYTHTFVEGGHAHYPNRDGGWEIDRFYNRTYETPKKLHFTGETCREREREKENYQNVVTLPERILEDGLGTAIKEINSYISLSLDLESRKIRK